MKANGKPRNKPTRAFALRLAAIALIAIASAYCTPADEREPAAELSDDETYLVDTYVTIVELRDLGNVSPLKSESLLTALDSTIDTLRIANTIRALNEDPDRWVSVFQRIEEVLRTPSGGKASEEPR